MRKKSLLFVLFAVIMSAVLLFGGCTAPKSAATSFRSNDLSKVIRLVRDFDHFTVRRRYDESFASVSEYKVTPECVSYLDADRMQIYVVYNDGNPYQLTQNGNGYDRTDFLGDYSTAFPGYGFIAVEEANWEYSPSEELYRSEAMPDTFIQIKGTVVTVKLQDYSIEFYDFGCTEVTVPKV